MSGRCPVGAANMFVSLKGFNHKAFLRHLKRSMMTIISTLLLSNEFDKTALKSSAAIDSEIVDSRKTDRCYDSNLFRDNIILIAESKQDVELLGQR